MNRNGHYWGGFKMENWWLWSKIFRFSSLKSWAIPWLLSGCKFDLTQLGLENFSILQDFFKFWLIQLIIVFLLKLFINYFSVFILNRLFIFSFDIHFLKTQQYLKIFQFPYFFNSFLKMFHFLFPIMLNVLYEHFNYSFRMRCPTNK